MCLCLCVQTDVRSNALGHDCLTGGGSTRKRPDAERTIEHMYVPIRPPLPTIVVLYVYCATVRLHLILCVARGARWSAQILYANTDTHVATSSSVAL